MSKFQIVLTSIFGILIVFAVFTFALYRGNSATQSQITIWGSFPSQYLSSIINNELNRRGDISFTYVEKNEETLGQEFTEALSEGGGPDLLLISQEELWGLKGKLLPIPYTNITERTFRESFAEGGEIFLLPDGIAALPLSIDPMILYYNRDLLSAQGIAKPIGYWDEIYAASGKLTRRDSAGNIIQSVMALGEASNIGNFKELLSLLFLQAGTDITAMGGSEGRELRSILAVNPGLPISPADAALDFYTQFANPAKNYYSWNRTLTDAQTNFALGESAYYAGFASELPVIRSKSSTLNLGFSLIPQSRINQRVITYGRIYGLAISRGTKNPDASLEAARRIIARDIAKSLSEFTALPPVRRDLLSSRPKEADASLFYDAALQAHGWLDPNPEGSRAVFKEAVESVTSGRARTSSAINEASRRLETLIKN